MKKVARERKPKETETGKTTELKQVCASSVMFMHWQLPVVQLVRCCVLTNQTYQLCWRATFDPCKE